jgi:allophanate hydrolase
LIRTNENGSSIELDDDTHVQGFLFEAIAAKDSEDISSLGGWKYV